MAVGLRPPAWIESRHNHKRPHATCSACDCIGSRSMWREAPPCAAAAKFRRSLGSRRSSAPPRSQRLAFVVGEPAERDPRHCTHASANAKNETSSRPAEAGPYTFGFSSNASRGRIEAELGEPVRHLLLDGIVEECVDENDAVRRGHRPRRVSPAALRARATCSSGVCAASSALIRKPVSTPIFMRSSTELPECSRLKAQGSRLKPMSRPCSRPALLHCALGIVPWALSIGHWALGIGH